MPVPSQAGSQDAYIHQLSHGQPGGPLVVLAHGTGGDEFQLLGTARALMADATLVAPRGDVSEFGAARFFRRTGEGIYDMADLARATAKMGGFIAAHRAAARPSRTIGIGYSNGANILAATLFAQPELFDALVLMHPLIPFQPEIAGSLMGKSVLITAGRRDPICPPEFTVRLEALLGQARANVTTAWHPGGHEVAPAELDAIKEFLFRTS